MGFDHKHGKGGAGHDSMWTSYSDLFLGLSIIFLLLYVSASLKQSTDGIRQNFENQKLSKESEDLRQQIKVYETIKQNYLKKEASNEEQSTYEELMSKLSLLQEDQKQEKNKLRMQAQDNEKKEIALNKYQQLIRNIINSNMIAKSRIKNRDQMIDNKEEIITEKSEEISGLEKTVATKSQSIQKGEAQIQKLEDQLDQHVRELKNAYKAQKISKQKFEAQQAALKEKAQEKIQNLQAANEKSKSELEQANQELNQTAAKLGAAQSAAAAAQSAASAAQMAAAKADQEKSKLKGQLQSVEAQHKGEVAKLDQRNKETQEALARATENLNARRKLANQIKANFAKSGVKAEVDQVSGDVMLSFGDQYFDTGNASLKPKMREMLQTAMPAYSSSLFENGKIAERIQSVEIVGFASPTYKGKYVNPASLEPGDRQAVNYNLDLSYARARSIFNYVFDKQQMSFKHQGRMLPLVKVTGRSFLSSEKRDPASQGGTEQFCRQNDCAKLQKVVIKFTLKD